ncbi:MAG TPA: hypothetical protein VHQ66_11515 [Myxococcota bacterium]|nr:hypothetical protein [Myxococcota bacterium]
MTRTRVLALAAFVLLLGALGLLVLRHGDDPAVRARAPVLPTPPPVAPAAPQPAEPPVADSEPQAPVAPLPVEPAPEGHGDPFAEAWSTVDLEEVRAALPDNRYWQDHAPTTDERVLREREEARASQNELYGKVLSGTGTEEEIRAYFEQRQRGSTDAIQFADYLLERHEGDFTERDQELLHLARRLHLARLQEIPRRLDEALARKRQQDEARAAWLADEARFRGESGAAAASREGPPDSDTDAP